MATDNRWNPRSAGRSRRTKRPTRPVDEPRLVAARTLMAVDIEGRFANLVLPKMLREAQTENPLFTSQDAAFTSELVYGTVRRQGTIDWVLAEHCSKLIEELDPPIRACLRMGAYQILFMRVADHAAVSETVSVARELAGEGPSKFVNAVLRSLLREGTEEALGRIDQISDDTERISVKHSHPSWIVDAVADSLDTHAKSLGTKLSQPDLMDAVESAVAANNTPAEVTLVARPTLIAPAELSAEAEDILGVATRQGIHSEYAVVLEAGDPGSLQAVRSGEAGVQDEGSQLAALILANAPIVSRPNHASDTKWLDLCAGPGGKAALLGAIGKERGATVTANEIGPRRAKLLERSVQALDNVKVTVADGRSYRGDDSFDRVLVDAPCLGLGSLRRRPESRWRHKPSDLDELLPLQEALLKRGIALARPGGVIAWVTCSPHVAETIGQVELALQDQPVELLDAAAIAQQLTPVDLKLSAEAPVESEPTTLGRQAEQIARKTVQLWPQIHGTDAMFIALFRKQ